ncbi:hypothetical protein [Komagataeibacter xylinus]|uniref:hypothetical protein n=1 Tax=Komagataeibacter xylinus TaxID=28448 RepID=UPI0012E842FF|nr:hypothetical protein [Komagataeibacter xylinus]GBQ67063.1 hypothetical protein AA15237_0070 [Komagataeibacter xylinus NBRC 15237]
MPPIVSIRQARRFMENAFLDLLDILAWQEGAPPATGHEQPVDPHRGGIIPDRGQGRS